MAIAHTEHKIHNITHLTYISAMLSGKLAGMAVSPLPRQSTILLLQVQTAGHEPAAKLHNCTPTISAWPAELRENVNHCETKWNVLRRLHYRTPPKKTYTSASVKSTPGQDYGLTNIP